MLALCGVAAPAQAASGFQLHVETATLAPGSDGKDVIIWGTVPGRGTHHLRLTVDRAGVDAFAAVTVDPTSFFTLSVGGGDSSYRAASPCTTVGLRTTCTITVTETVYPNPLGMLWVEARPNATTRDSGIVKVTGSILTATTVWTTAAEWSDMTSVFDGGTPAVPGTGPELTLTELTGAAAEPQADLDQENNHALLDMAIGGGPATDLAVLGARGSAPVGGRLTLRVTLVNHGPRRIRPDLYLNNMVTLEVRPPGNTEIVGSDCLPIRERMLWCYPSKPLAAGASQTFAVRLKVTKGSPTPGRVRFGAQMSGYARPVDPDRANDSAEIVVTPRGA
ncbi:hypothetical protein Acsp01_75970 [Actinoplanes sp. NBRC 101535]|nr:hypothetical protein Acsp01_75970 [Actinoplanes sp. NBRC 101535]